MTELGQTGDPTALIPGDTDAIYRTEGSLIRYGDLLHEAGTGLQRIDTSAGWSGAAADAFRTVFHGQPGKWLRAGDAFHSAASALDDYAATLGWAQQQAAAAIGLWNSGPAHHQAAHETLNNARAQLQSAGDAAAAAVGRARDLAPPKPGFWSQVGSFFSGLGHDAVSAGETVVNDVASLGNAAVHHPGDLAMTIGGTALAAVSTLGDGAGLALDATGVGAVPGVALNALSTAGLGAGVSLAGAGISGILQAAAGGDHVNLMNSDSAPSGGSSGGADSAPKTKQEIAEQARQLGYDRRVPLQKAPFNSHGQQVFTDGKDFLTPDADGHNVSNGWKLVNRRGNRIGTYTWDLTRVKD